MSTSFPDKWLMVKEYIVVAVEGTLVLGSPLVCQWYIVGLFPPVSI